MTKQTLLIAFVLWIALVGAFQYIQTSAGTASPRAMGETQKQARGNSSEPDYLHAVVKLLFEQMLPDVSPPPWRSANLEKYSPPNVPPYYHATGWTGDGKRYLIEIRHVGGTWKPTAFIYDGRRIG